MIFSSSSIISYAIKNNTGAWYYCGVEYWIMNDWSQWGIDLSQDIATVEETFLQVLQEFRIEQVQLEAKFQQMSQAPQAFFLLPLVVADFDNRHFFSNYYDRLLETMVLDGWAGTFGDVLEKIPESDRYWLNSHNPI